MHIYCICSITKGLWVFENKKQNIESRIRQSMSFLIFLVNQGYMEKSLWDRLSAWHSKNSYRHDGAPTSLLNLHHIWGHMTHMHDHEGGVSDLAKFSIKQGEWVAINMRNEIAIIERPHFSETSFLLMISPSISDARKSIFCSKKKNTHENQLVTSSNHDVWNAWYFLTKQRKKPLKRMKIFSSCNREMPHSSSNVHNLFLTYPSCQNFSWRFISGNRIRHADGRDRGDRV
jgi:hypothetical protein